MRIRLLSSQRGQRYCRSTGKSIYLWRGKRPQINTNGHGQWELNYGNPLDNQNHKWKGTVSSSILIEDAEYLEIEGLELTNDRESSTDTEKDKKYNDADAMDRTGVAGVAKIMEL